MFIFLLFGPGGVFFFLPFGRGACSFFCCLGGGVFFVLLFGRGRVLFFAVWAGGVFFFFAVWAGDGSSLTYPSAWLVFKRPNNKRDRTAKKKHGFQPNIMDDDDTQPWRYFADEPGSEGVDPKLKTLNPKS